MRLLAVLLIASALAGLVVLPAPAAPVARLWTGGMIAAAAAEFAGKLDAKQAKYVRLLSLHAIPPAKRPRLIQALGLVVNSLSRNDLLTLPQAVPGTNGVLVWFDLSLLRDRDDVKGLCQLVEAFDKLGEVGSGPAPLPEPYFHANTYEDYEDTEYGSQEYGYYFDAYNRAWSEPAEGRTWRTTETRRVAKAVKKRRRKVALSPALNRATAAGLAIATATNFPIFDARWFVVNALSEPRYHELLGLDDDEKSVLKLTGADEKSADRAGSQLRGAVLFSEVAQRNRVLERTPLANIRHGRGTFQRSFDFKTSVLLQDVLKDLLVAKADAHEIIFNLPNGLLGYYVSDGAGKRLDKADADVAVNRRGGWDDPQVRVAYMCLACHLPRKGWIEVDDEARESAKKRITLASLAFDEKGNDRGKKVRQKYFAEDFNALLKNDQALVEASVKAATGGLTSAEAAREIVGVIKTYLQEPVDAIQLATELGTTPEMVMKLGEIPGVDHVAVGLRIGRKQRRDQVEQSFAQLSTLLYLGK